MQRFTSFPPSKLHFILLILLGCLDILGPSLGCRRRGGKQLLHKALGFALSIALLPIYRITSSWFRWLLFRQVLKLDSSNEKTHFTPWEEAQVVEDFFFAKYRFLKKQRKLDQMNKWCKIYINVSLNVEFFRPYPNSKPVFKRLPGCFGESHSWLFLLPRSMSSGRRSQVFGVEVLEFQLEALLFLESNPY